MTTESAPLPLIRYGRTSRLGGRNAADNVSRNDQFSVVDRIAAQYELPTMPEDFYDSDVSGSTFERPQWERAMAMIREGKAGGIIAFNFKRIGRAKTAEMLAMVEDVESLGGQLYDETGRVSVDDADAEMITTLKAMIGRRDWRERRAYLLSNVEGAIARGVHLSEPFGYQRSAGKGTPLAINEAEAPAVRMAYAMRAEGHSWQTIAEAINTTAIMPRPYTRQGFAKQAVWTYKTVRQLVVGRDGNGNRVYLGTAWNGQHATEGAHPAIVAEDIFRAANDARGVKHAGPDHGYLLSGLVRCKSCGYAMTYNGPGFMRCRAAQHGDGRCPAPVGVNAPELEALVVADFKARLRAAVDVEADDADDALIAAGAETRRQKMRHANLLAMMPDDASDGELENWKQSVKQASEALRAATRREREAQANARGANLPVDLNADNFDTWPLPDQRTFLSALFAAVVVRRPERWREPVAERYGVVLRDQGPAHNLALIAHVAASA